MSKIRAVRKYLRYLIPFPKRKTLAKIFPSYEVKNLGYLLKKYEIDQVVDVGANRGQFVDKIRSVGYNGKVISFEPLAFEHNFLCKRAAKDNTWAVAPRMAIGDRDGNVTINVTHDTSLSSIQASVDKSLMASTEDVKMMTLDKSLNGQVDSASNLLIKIDVQGYEPQVIQGAAKTLSKAKAVMLEVGLMPMYEEEVSYLDILTGLRAQGFHMVFISHVTRGKKLGELYQIDAFLVKNPPFRFQN
jgi:FkbM family methyltransferase